jgi:hypothetical protein
VGYGKNVEFRVVPEPHQRLGRFVTPSTGSPIAMGVPIGIDTAVAVDAMGRNTVKLITGATNPIKGLHGILVYEYKGQEGWAGDDPYLTTYSDKSTVPLAQSCQMVSGDNVKVCLRNTVSSTFLNNRTYTGRIMVAGTGATPTVVVGDYLTPGTGDDTNGYWAEGNATNGWLLVTRVDLVRSEVEAVMRF